MKLLSIHEAPSGRGMGTRGALPLALGVNRIDDATQLSATVAYCRKRLALIGVVGVNDNGIASAIRLHTYDADATQLNSTQLSATVADS